MAQITLIHNNVTMSQETKESYINANWLDLPLIADDKTSDYMNRRYNDQTGQSWYYQALVLNDEHLYMWNMTSNEIRMEDKLRDIREVRHPFWVDERSIAHIFPETPLVGTKCNKRKYPTDNIIDEQSSKKITYIFNKKSPSSLDGIISKININNALVRDLPSASIDTAPFSGKSTSHHDIRWIRVLTANDVTSILRIFPTMPLLLIDQYKMFIQKGNESATNLTFGFTGAPVKGHLSDNEEWRFWQRIEEQSTISKDTMAYPLNSANLDNTKQHISQNTTNDRQCYKVWYYFIPNPDHLVQDDTTKDLRIIDIHLMDSNDTLVWRNLIAAFIENDHAYFTKKEDEYHEESRVIIIIRLRYCAKEAQERANERRAALSTKFKSNNELENYLKQLMLSKAKLHFKRFAAFFVRAIEQRQIMRHAPRLFWTMRDNEQSVIHLIYHEIFRETIKGMLHNMIEYDRFLKIEPQFNERSNKNNGEIHHQHYRPDKGHLIISRCRMRESTDEQKRSDNILGIFQDVLMNNNVFSSNIYYIPQSGIYIKKHKSGAPIYKLHMNEV